MIKAITRRWPQGCSRVLLSIVLGGAWPMLALAQRGNPRDQPKETPKADAKAKGEAPKGEAPADENAAPKGPAAISRTESQKKQAEADLSQAKAADPTEVWEDPNAADCLQNNFPELYPTARSVTQAD